MSLDLPLLLANPLKVFAIIVLFSLLKGSVLFAIGRVARMPNISSIRFAALLAQGGEFAFVLFKMAQAQNTLQSEEANLLVLAVTLSMAASPLLYGAVKILLEKSELAKQQAPEYDQVDEQNPVIIAGYGRFGQIVGRVLRMKGINATALEHDPEHVETLRKFGQKVFYGDASRLDLLEAAGAAKAKLFVLAIDDPDASVATAEVLRKHFPHLKVFARARNRNHVFRLRDLGVHHVVRETFHSSLEMAELSLQVLGDSALAAEIACNFFRQNDEKLLDEQYKNYHEEEHVIAVSKQATTQLTEAFRADQREN
jgi:voltage-gated potassium channel Kch